jgi:hypothetical protein
MRAAVAASEFLFKDSAVKVLICESPDCEYRLNQKPVFRDSYPCVVNAIAGFLFASSRDPRWALMTGVRKPTGD